MFAFIKFNLFVFFLFIVFALCKKTHFLKSAIIKSQSKTSIPAYQITAITKGCLREIIKAAPPYFCWNNGADAGIIPTNCPSGYFRFLALCYKQCQSTQFLSVLLACPSLTNFDDRVTCNSGYYKIGALCYRDCGKVGMKNCGIGACSNTDWACAEILTKYTINAFSAIANTVSLALAFDSAYQSYLSTLQSDIKVVSVQALDESYSSFSSYMERDFGGSGSSNTLTVLDSITNNVLSSLTFTAAYQTVLATCAMTAINLNEQTQKFTTVSDYIQDNVFNFNGFSDTKGDCSSGNTLVCANDILKYISLVDPTGFIALANTFLLPTCSGAYAI